MIRGFVARLAWREGRAAYRRLSVFVSSIALGVGSLVAIHSFRADVQRSLGDQARALLGADVRVSSNRAFPEAFDAVLDSMAAQERDVARTTTLASPPHRPLHGRRSTRGLRRSPTPPSSFNSTPPWVTRC